MALFEKAYLQVHGGTYEFLGSNSGADLYSLCGWVPDVVNLESSQVSPKLEHWKAWAPLFLPSKGGNSVWVALKQFKIQWFALVLQFLMEQLQSL